VDDRSHAEALSRFRGKPPALRMLPFFLEGIVSERRTRNPADRSRGGNKLFQIYAETRAALLCSMCFLTLRDSARSASRRS
jgi:hypothetical protein